MRERPAAVPDAHPTGVHPDVDAWIAYHEGELVAAFKEKGLDIYTPDVEAFRAHVQKMYLESDLAKAWPPGMIERINAL